ncbi:MAG: SUMF1/EgtB/PvdO family nonheme iron enzyme, partial [Chloroflexi bacterium AL-N5]|nr:SUMF1/EgtB/PvdO family nonheme iron enzyme [Chloroflexi bacterium AL-N5]
SFPTTFGKPTGYWCYVPAGTYRIGGWEEDEPAADMTLPEYWMACFSITVAQFRPFVEVGYTAEAKRWWTPQGWQWQQKYKDTEPWGWDDPTWNGDNQPVIGVTWYEAVAFVNWLDEQLNNALPEGYHLCLPTEAEWEVAAAYDGTGQRRTYPWGEDAPTTAHAVFEDSKLKRSAPIGCYPQGVAACGAFDMVGNVFEWTCSHGAFYPEEGDQVMADFDSGEFNTPIRGGSWSGKIEHMLCRARRPIFPDRYIRDYLGFRVVVARRDGGA